MIYQAFLATLNPGDEVLIPAPYWASYADIVGMNAGVLKPMVTTPDQRHALQPETLEAAITSRTTRIEEMGATPLAGTSEAFAHEMRPEYAKWKQVAVQGHISLEAS